MLDFGDDDKLSSFFYVELTSAGLCVEKHSDRHRVASRLHSEVDRGHRLLGARCENRNRMIFPKCCENHNGLIVPNGLKDDTWCIRQRPGRSMRLLYALAAVTLLTVLLPVLHASAFTIDPASGTNPDGSSRFMDPDEQSIHPSSAWSAVNEDGWADRNSAYRNFSPGADGSNQGITFPNLFFPTIAAPLKHQSAMKGMEGKRLTYRPTRQQISAGASTEIR
jgi:hypothetical protein